MKTIIENDTRLSKYIFDDDVQINLLDSVIETPFFIVSDLNKNNASLFEQVSAPADWVGNKYCFDGQSWTIAPDWIEPQGDGSENL